MRPARFSSAVAAFAFGAGAVPPHAFAEEGFDNDSDHHPRDARAGDKAASWLTARAEDAHMAALAPRAGAAPEARPANRDGGGALLATGDLSQSSHNGAGANDRPLRIPAATAFAASLTASEDTCMGSRSFGVQAIGFGFSLATTWPDRQCRRVRNARALDELGYPRAALALLCQDDDVRSAMHRAGTPCPGLELAQFDPSPPPQLDEPEAPPLISFNDVLFDFDRSTLRPEANAILEPLLAMMQADSSMSIDIEGHTDWVGTDAYNQGLSERRARAVVEWLVARGIARERISAVGRGENEPVATNHTAAGRQLNRRVEIRRRAS